MPRADSAMASAGSWHDTPETLVAVFKNSLLYTTAFEISALIPKGNGDTTVIIIAAVMLVVLMINKLSAFIATVYSDAPDEVKRIVEPLKALTKFLLDCASNLLVQITSTMVGQLVTTAVQETQSSSFSLLGSLVSLTLIWLLSNMITSR
jgi:hypothetical protein